MTFGFENLPQGTPVIVFFSNPVVVSFSDLLCCGIFVNFKDKSTFFFVCKKCVYYSVFG